MKKLTVLLADDDKIIRMLMKKNLEKLDFEICGEAVNGNEAVELYKKLKPHLLLLDLDMPEKNGEDALKEIIKEFPDAFVIMLTSHKQREVVGACFKFGATDFIPKDASRERIHETIQEASKKRFVEP